MASCPRVGCALASVLLVRMPVGAATPAKIAAATKPRRADIFIFIPFLSRSGRITLSYQSFRIPVKTYQKTKPRVGLRPVGAPQNRHGGNFVFKRVEGGGQVVVGVRNVSQPVEVRRTRLTRASTQANEAPGQA